MGTIPGSHSLNGTVAPVTGAAIDIILDGNGPTGCTRLQCLGKRAPGIALLRHINDMVQERQVHFTEVGGVGRPVVHLYVYIGMNITMPEA